MSFAGSSCSCSARRANKLSASLGRISLGSDASAAPQTFATSRHPFTTSAPPRAVRGNESSSPSGSGQRPGKSNSSAWTPDRSQPMLPIQPRQISWEAAMSQPLYKTPALATTPRVPLSILAPFDPASSSSVAPDATTTSTKPVPFIVGAKYTLRYAKRSIDLHLGSGKRGRPHEKSPSYRNPERLANVRSNMVGYQPHKVKLTRYDGFSRPAEVAREAGSSPKDLQNAMAEHAWREEVEGNYSDHVARGPMLARLLRGTASKADQAALKKQSDDQVVSDAHAALQVADQALALNPSLTQAAKQFVLHAIRDRVDPTATTPSPETTSPAAKPAASSPAKGKKKK